MSVTARGWTWVRIAVIAVTASVAAAGCTQLVTGDRTGHVRVENDTTTAVAVHVNGSWAGTYPAGAVVDVPIRGHGGPPFDIEIRSPSGAVLTEVTFTADDVRSVEEGGGSANGSSVDCGWIQIGFGITDFSEPDGIDARPTAGGVCP